MATEEARFVRVTRTHKNTQFRLNLVNICICVFMPDAGILRASLIGRVRKSCFRRRRWSRGRDVCLAFSGRRRVLIFVGLVVSCGEAPSHLQIYRMSTKAHTRCRLPDWRMLADWAAGGVRHQRRDFVSQLPRSEKGGTGEQERSRFFFFLHFFFV